MLFSAVRRHFCCHSAENNLLYASCKEFGGGGSGGEGEESGGGWHEDGFALADGHLRFFRRQRRFSGEAHHHNKGIQTAQIFAHRLAQVPQRGGEIRATDQPDFLIQSRGVGRPVIRIDRIVDGILGLLRVQLTGLAVQPEATVVVDAIGDVGSLLNLGDEAAGADCVNAAGGQEKDIAGLNLVAGEHLGKTVIRHSAFVFLRGDGLRKAR